MKVYIITETQMEELRMRLELNRLRSDNVTHASYEGKSVEEITESLWRAFNFVVCRWRDDVGRS